MEIDYAKSLTKNQLQKLYSGYLKEAGKDLTKASDAFYLYNNKEEESFWKILIQDYDEEDARKILEDCMLKNSEGKVKENISVYYSALKDFKNFVNTYDINEDKNRLRDFLLDEKCLDPLYDWIKRVNIFDILKISRTEIRHSNMLAWLMDPSESHGLGSGFIREIFNYIGDNYDKDIFKILLSNCNDFVVFREYHQIDLLAVSNNLEIVLSIENKTQSGEHGNQLLDYKNFVEETYAGYTHYFIYLTPNGNESSDPSNWLSMKYEDILDIINIIRDKSNMVPEVELIINNYIETVRRNIVGDEKLAEICAQIYRKHKKALDLIYENRPDRALEVFEFVMGWALDKMKNGEILFDSDASEKKYIRFKTERMSEIIPEAKEAISGWKNNDFYYYEVNNSHQGENVFIQFTISKKNLPQELEEICNKITTQYPTKKGWKWWDIPFVSDIYNINAEDELDKEQLKKKLDEMLEQIKKFEEELAKVY